MPNVGTDAPLGPVIADMLGATAGDLEGADEMRTLPILGPGHRLAIRVVKQSPLLVIGRLRPPVAARHRTDYTLRDRAVMLMPMPSTRPRA